MPKHVDDLQLGPRCPERRRKGRSPLVALLLIKHVFSMHNAFAQAGRTRPVIFQICGFMR
jgi:hypothetical protein